MSLTYEIPSNSPTSAVRLYRFPYRGERDSTRLNLMMQAIAGDIKLIYNALEDAEEVSMTDVGGRMMTTIPANAFIETGD